MTPHMRETPFGRSTTRPVEHSLPPLPSLFKPVGNAAASSSQNFTSPCLCCFQSCHYSMLLAQHTIQKHLISKRKKQLSTMWTKSQCEGSTSTTVALGSGVQGGLKFRMGWCRCFMWEIYGITQAKGEVSDSSLKGRWGHATILNRHLKRRHLTLVLIPLEREWLYETCRG